MDTIPRVEASVVRPMLKADNARPAILVCAYDDSARCQRIHIDGAIPWTEFVRTLSGVPREQQVVFYCT
jgi:hypothetical protein